MAGKQTIVIVGASARAAAFSALRAGLEPYCLDLFADADLRARCPVVKLDAARYPRQLEDELPRAPPGPWMYTGGLENHRRLVERLARERKLWGNDRAVLRQVRSPQSVQMLLTARRVPCPPVSLCPPQFDPQQPWLAKPLAGAGGSGIGYWHPAAPAPRQPVYYQPYLGDRSAAAVFLGDDHGCQLLGVTEQLVGVPWLNARPFHYCGSIGPVRDIDRPAYESIGSALAEGMHVRGLFGVDVVPADGVIWPVEVNPRFTASVEVLEYAAGRPFLELHRRAFEPAAAVRPGYPIEQMIGKAILFAGEPFTFPAEGPWLADLDPGRPLVALPAFADIPAAGTFIERGHPVLTFFATGTTMEEVRERLQGIAAELNRRFAPSTSPL